MSDIAISVENLSKSYLLGHNNAKAERYTALRDVIANNARNLARKTRDMLQGKAIVQGDEVEEFWALKDINFEIKQGDRVGIIGRNGAGKSTLLKILSRITEPTTGRIKINGRVASLLEVGTGFHPELTGRENIFLNGAILGMSRREIQRKFDEIVDFAEVEKFLDTPVKRYSSGMYVRLAFAVAAHLEPEILIVDEVLAVGDAQFQQKCLGKMENVASQGRTVLFVSHNMVAINNLCEKSILLNKGQIQKYDNSSKVIDGYYANIDAKSKHCNFHTDKNKTLPHFKEISIVDDTTESLSMGGCIELAICVSGLKKSDKIQLSFILKRSDGINIYHFMSADQDFYIEKKDLTAHVKVILKDIKLYPGNYVIDDLWLADLQNTTLDLHKDCLSFKINQGNFFEKRILSSNAGIIYASPDWQSVG